MSKKRIRAVKVAHPVAWAAKSPSDPREYYTWQLPATAEAYDQMVDQIAHGFCASDDFVWDGIHYNVSKYYNLYARAALRAIGIEVEVTP